MSEETKKIVFLSGTRADFGKIKSLIQKLENHKDFNPFVFVTGMHLIETYGYTLIEIERCKFSNVHAFKNHTSEATMDLTLAKTIEGFSNYVKKIQPNLIVVHGDRVEAMAGAIVGALNNILVAHIEGGELSGTVDELIRHSVSKMSHIHYVSNKNSIKVIGSPDIDIMFSSNLPTLDEVKKYYEIPFNNYALAMFHPVTTEYSKIEEYARNFVDALLKDDKNYEKIIKAYNKLKNNSRFRIFPSIRFEYFLSLLKNSNFIVGNSSAGIREAPYYGIPTINIGSRQENRSLHSHMTHVSYKSDDIFEALKSNHKSIEKDHKTFGIGNSSQLFLESLLEKSIWTLNTQKNFVDIH